MILEYMVRSKDPDKEDLIMEDGDVFQFRVPVSDEMEAYQQMTKVFFGAQLHGHEVINVFLNGKRFNPRGWYTNGMNADKVRHLTEIEPTHIIDQINGFEDIVAERVYLKCPFEDKEECKSLGGRWDPIKKCWFIPSSCDPSSFSKWRQI